MAWVTCPHCGFTQIPAVECLKCHKRLDRTAREGEAPAAADAPLPSKAPAPSVGPVFPRQLLYLFGALALLIVSGIILWSARSSVEPPHRTLARAPTPEPWSLDLTGRWQGKIATTIAGPPSRPALRELFLETDRSGNIVAAGVTLTDPGQGGAGAGYLGVPDGQRRVREAAAALAATPHSPLSLDFIPFAPWVPKRDRLWRAVEGQRRNPAEATYLLVESLEPDYLVQAGLNASGFLSYLYLSPAYASGRGSDVLSKVIHPGADSALRGFRNLVWDLSGSADFVGLQVNATLSGPAGTMDRIVLRR
jgi:hypothetical protein